MIIALLLMFVLNCMWISFVGIVNVKHTDPKIAAGFSH